MAWQDWLGAGAALGGALINSSAAKDAAAAQIEAGKVAADMAKFTPYGVTSGFGTGWFDAETQTAGYQLDPALAAYRDKLMGMGAEALPGTMNIDEASQSYYDQMQQMMAPARQQEQLGLQQNLFGSGRLGMRLAGEGAGAGTGGGMYQPDILGYNKAQELANQQLAMQSRQQAFNEMDAAINRGTGLFTQGFGVEQLGMMPMTLGAEFGGRASSAGATAANAMLQGGMGAAQANLASGLGWSNTLKDFGLGMMQYGGGR